jgi:hypothetical protein
MDSKLKTRRLSKLRFVVKCIAKQLLLGRKQILVTLGQMMGVCKRILSVIWLASLFLLTINIITFSLLVQFHDIFFFVLLVTSQLTLLV